MYEDSGKDLKRCLMDFSFGYRDIAIGFFFFKLWNILGIQKEHGEEYNCIVIYTQFKRSLQI